MASALILGVTGAIGWATARRLLASGWDVVVTGRSLGDVPSGLRDVGTFVAADRNDAASLQSLVGDGLDLLVDCVCYTAAQAALLMPLLGDVASIVMISTKAVYVDRDGRHSNSEVSPHFLAPIKENQETVRPNGAVYDSREGYGPNKVAAEEALLDSGRPVTVLRPSKIHGAWARLPREWVFVKRVLDHRSFVVLAHRGDGADHPSAAVNVAALIEVVARKPGRRIVNSADPDCPSGLEISRTIATYLGHQWEEILLGEQVEGEQVEGLGGHPWNVVPPVVLDTSAAENLGYRPVGSYAQTIRQELDWLIASTKMRRLLAHRCLSRTRTSSRCLTTRRRISTWL